ncbi:MAG: phospholipase D-like domain-containing protein [Myxococcota bacterium]|nr:phospholipase D-like domain-containing protein [Myxococcota bacterium]
MNPSVFQGFLTENTPDIKWTKKKKDTACQVLFAIAKANGGEIFEDEKIPRSEKEQFAINRAREALERRFISYANAVARQRPDFSYTQPVDEKANDTLTTRHQWLPKVDINTASFDELEALPEIGDVLAQRIIDHRNLYGPFESIEQLKEVKGIDNVTTQRLEALAFVMPADVHAQFFSPEVLAFVSEPSLKTYARLLASGGGFAVKADLDGTPLDRLLVELSSIQNEVDQNEFFPNKHLPLTRASRIKALNGFEKKARALEAKAIKGKDGAAGLLFDEAYAPFVKQLIQNATQSIKIIMFYMKYDKAGKDTPSDQLVKELVVAKKRGVEIQVILDRDREGDVYRSRLINHNAFKALQQAGIDVVFDEFNRVNHTKLVVVDDRHVVIGSHNWTLGSLKKYDETSLYVASKPLAKTYLDNFKSRFEKLSAN